MARRLPWRCVHCGSWRIYANRACHTCERMKVRYWIERRMA